MEYDHRDFQVYYKIAILYMSDLDNVLAARYAYTEL